MNPWDALCETAVHDAYVALATRDPRATLTDALLLVLVSAVQDLQDSTEERSR